MSEDLLDVAQQPAEIPAKFRDPATGALRVEALLKSYLELERTLSRRMTPPGETRPRDFFSFLSGRVDTIYGPVRAGEALLQVILVPLCLGIGGIVIGLIIQSARVAH